MSPVLRLEGVTVRLGGRTVLEGAGGSVRRGERVALLGPNGAGKSTFFRAAAGLVRLASGRVELDGVDLAGWPLHRRARAGLGYLAQEPSAFGGLTVRDNLWTALELRVPAAARPARYAEVVARLGLEAVEDRRAEHLSGGERRRLEVARLLAVGPRVLLLDEPFAGLDPRSAAELGRHLVTVAGAGTAVVFSDHVPARALDLAEAVIVLAGGRVVLEGTPEGVRRAELMRSLGFDRPLKGP